MNNPNPFVPQGSLLEQQSKRRSRLKVGVFCVLAVGITGLAAMLIQGCKREQENGSDNADNNPPPVDTNNVAAASDTNTSPTDVSNAPNVAATPPEATPQTPAGAVPPATPPQEPVSPAAPAPASTENEYVVVKGDYMAKIARDHGITLKALRDANPDVQPTRLKIGEKLVIPAGGSTGANATGDTGAAANGDEIYVVKPGDTLSKIAHHYGVTIHAIEAENNLSTTKINVGKKLQIPAKQEAAPATATAAPVTTAAPEPAPAAAPANPPAQPSAPSQQ